MMDEIERRDYEALKEELEQAASLIGKLVTIVNIARKSMLERYDTHGWIECLYCHNTRRPVFTKLGETRQPIDMSYHKDECNGVKLMAAIKLLDGDGDDLHPEYNLRGWR